MGSYPKENNFYFQEKKEIKILKTFHKKGGLNKPPYFSLTYRGRINKNVAYFFIKLSASSSVNEKSAAAGTRVTGVRGVCRGLVASSTPETMAV